MGYSKTYLHPPACSAWGNGTKSTAEGKILSENVFLLGLLFLGYCLFCSKNNTKSCASKLFVHSLRVNKAMVKNVKHSMSKTNCCPNNPNSEADKGSFDLERKVCFEALDFMKDYKKSFYLLLFNDCCPTRPSVAVWSELHTHLAQPLKDTQRKELYFGLWECNLKFDNKNGSKEDR